MIAPQHLLLVVTDYDQRVQSSRGQRVRKSRDRLLRRSMSCRQLRCSDVLSVMIRLSSQQCVEGNQRTVAIKQRQAAVIFLVPREIGRIDQQHGCMRRAKTKNDLSHDDFPPTALYLVLLAAVRSHGSYEVCYRTVKSSDG